MSKIYAFIFISAFALGNAALAQVQVPLRPHATKSTAAVAPTPRQAGEFVIHMPDGSQKLLSSYRGKTVVLAFMHTTCPHCQHTAGILAKIQTEYGAKGVQVLGVTFDDGAKNRVADFIKLTGANYPCGYSTRDVVEKFMRLGPDYYVPILALIDRNGVVRFQNVVLMEGDPASVFLQDQETNIRKELDKFVKTTTSVAARKTPKS